MIKTIKKLTYFLFLFPLISVCVAEEYKYDFVWEYCDEKTTSCDIEEIKGSVTPYESTRINLNLIKYENKVVDIFTIDSLDKTVNVYTCLEENKVPDITNIMDRYYQDYSSCWDEFKGTWSRSEPGFIRIDFDYNTIKTNAPLRFSENY